jgi:hypothetical protein
MQDVGDNTRRLIDAGVIPGPLPEPYDQVIADLSSQEVESLISVKSRLDKANADAHGGEGNVGFIGMVVPL